MKPMKPLKPKCYVCGQPIEKKFIIFSLSRIADRLFVADFTCASRLDDVAYVMVVRKSK